MINQQYLKTILNYDSDTGILMWAKNGIRAGCHHSLGYRLIGLKGRKYKEHRIIWMYVHGEFPESDIDHINRIKDDNRISNLRLASESENGQNMVNAQSHSKTKVLGVSPSKGKYVASIQINGKKKHLGRFNSIAEAGLAYRDAKKELHKFCNTHIAILR